MIPPDLWVEWKRRLDDFDRKGWHNRVEVLKVGPVEYVGMTNREADAEDRCVVRLEAFVRDYVEDANGNHIERNDSSSDTSTVCQYWTLGKIGDTDRWRVVSIEEQAEGDHQLGERLVATPWADDERLRDESVVEGAVAEAPAGVKTAEIADLDFDGDARAAANDLSLADPRFEPAVLEAAARAVVGGWAEAVDGSDDPLAAVASPEALEALLHPRGEKTRLVVRGPHVQRLRIAALDAAADPPTMTVEVDVKGRRYIEDRDTTTVVSGSRDSETTFTERWTLALDGSAQAPWRIVDAAAARRPARRSLSGPRGLATGGHRGPRYSRGNVGIGRLGVRQHPLLERQLGVEVGVVGVAEGDVVAGEDRDEGLDDDGVELGAGAALELAHRVHRGDRVAVGVARRHDVVGVGDGDDPRQQRDLARRPGGAGSPCRPALVVGQDDLGDRAVAVDLGDDPRALVGVHADDLPVALGERDVGLEDVVGEDELADVVQQAGGVDELLVLRRAARARERSPRA